MARKQRDPRVDPQPGDQVHPTDKWFPDRLVQTRKSDEVTYCLVAHWWNGKEKLGCCSVITWRQWCRENRVRVVLVAGEKVEE